MTAKSFDQHSCGQSFTDQSGVTDLSSLAVGSLLAHTSQAGGNTTVAKAGYLQNAAGTKSEQTSTDLMGNDLESGVITDPVPGVPQYSAPNRVEVHGDGEVFGL